MSSMFISLMQKKFTKSELKEERFFKLKFCDKDVGDLKIPFSN